MDDTLGERIRRARIADNLTVTELASRSGVSHQTIGNWENGKTAPRPDLVARLQPHLSADLGLDLAVTLRSVPNPGAEQERPGRLVEATTPQMLAELHVRYADTADKLTAAQARIAELEAEVARLRGTSRTIRGSAEWGAQGRFAARHDDPPNDPDAR